MLNEFQLQDYIKKADILLRPYLIYCHPDDKKLVEEAIGDICVIDEILWVEQGKIIVMDRAKLEEMNKFGFVDFRDIGKEE